MQFSLIDLEMNGSVTTLIRWCGWSS